MVVSPEQKQRRAGIFDADDKNQHAVVEQLTRTYVEDFPDDSIGWFHRGVALSAHCRYEEADRAFEESFQTTAESNHYAIWSAQAESFKKRGNRLEAEGC